MCTSTAIWIFRCLNEWLRSIARIPEANVTFNKRGNKSEAEKTKVTCLSLAFGDLGKGRMEYSNWKRRVSSLQTERKS